MSHLRDEAEALAECLGVGVCNVQQVIAWSDAHLLRENPPPIALCDVSLAQNRYPEDVAGLLRQLPGTPDKRRVGGLLTSLLRAKLKRDPDRADQIACGLRQLTLFGPIENPRLEDVAGWTWIALEDAEEGGVEGSRERIIARMSAALHEASGEAGIGWSVDVC